MLTVPVVQFSGSRSLLLTLTSPVIARDDDVNAKISQGGGMLRIENADGWAWYRVTLKLNAGIFSNGYMAEVDRIESGQAVSIPLREFATSSGERFNTFSTKLLDIQIIARDSNGKMYFSMYGFKR